VNFQALSSEQVKSVIEGRSIADRVPMTVNFWTNAETFGEDRLRATGLLKTYPNDVSAMEIRMPEIFLAPEDEPEYRWVNYKEPDDGQNKAIDSRVAIPDLSLLDDILSNFPRPDYAGMFPKNQVNDG
jgi:hypothetical protein